jgi:hypothetical protein
MITYEGPDAEYNKRPYSISNTADDKLSQIIEAILDHC